MIKMKMVAVLAAGVLLGSCLMGTAGAAPRCLVGTEWRHAIETHRALPLVDIMRSLGAGLEGEIVAARLCETPDGLHYSLTIVGAHGRIVRANIQAATGHLINQR
jgi:hypothetical protein